MFIYKEGWFIDKRKRLKYKNTLWFVNVSTYQSKRMKLTISNKKQEIEVTIDLKDAYLDNGHVFLDPEIKDNGILKALKKSRILRQIDGTLCYDYKLIPVALLNNGILRTYDYSGVLEHMEKITNKEDWSINNNRLKLYNTHLTLRLDKKEKQILRKNAYKNKMTMSNYIRLLINMDNRLNEIKRNNIKNDKYSTEIAKIMLNIGRDIDV